MTPYTRDRLILLAIIFGVLFALYGCAVPIQMERVDKTPTTGAVIETVAEAYAISIAFNFLNTVYINNGFPR